MQWYESYYTYYIIFFLIVTIILSTLYTKIDPWYHNLAKPPGVPPNWVFGMVWSILYLLILIATCMIAWDYVNEDSFPIVCLYTIILCLMLLWTITFFVFRMTRTALVILILLLIASSIMVWLVSSQCIPTVFYSLFLFWICCAFYFNLGIAIKN